MPTGKLILGLVGAAIMGLTVYTGGAGLIPFFVGVRSVRVSEGATQLRVTASDAEASHVCGYVAFAIVPGLLVLGFVSFAIGVLASLLLWASLRVVVTCDGRETLITRRVLWVVPWRSRRSVGRPDAFVDGWGDFADPAALYLASPCDGDRLELGWSHKGNEGRAEALAAQIVGWRPHAGPS